MHLSVSAQFSLKDRPEDYRGITSQRVTWAKKSALSFSHLARYVLGEIMDWYGVFEQPDVLAEQRDKLIEWLQGIRFVAADEEASDGKGVR